MQPVIMSRMYRLIDVSRIAYVAVALSAKFATSTPVQVRWFSASRVSVSCRWVSGSSAARFFSMSAQVWNRKASAARNLASIWANSEWKAGLSRRCPARVLPSRASSATSSSRRRATPSVQPEWQMHAKLIVPRR